MPPVRRRAYGKQQKYVLILRAHEFAERQKVSLLEIPLLGFGRIRRLWNAGITTAQELLDADAERVFAILFDRPAPRHRAHLWPEFERLMAGFVELCAARGVMRTPAAPRPASCPPPPDAREGQG